MYYFYILECKDGTLYCGISNNVARRLQQHNSGKGSAYVRSRGGGIIVYSEKYKNMSNAMRREREVKDWPRRKKQELIGR